MPELQVMRSESWAPRGAQPKSRAVHGRRSRLAKQVMEELRRVGRSDRLPLFRGQSNRLGSQSDRQPLFYGRSDQLGSRSDRQPLFRVRSDRLGSRSDRQEQSAVKNPVEREAPAVVRAWEPLRESHSAVRSLNR
jgi:hypothetical protein